MHVDIVRGKPSGKTNTVYVIIDVLRAFSVAQFLFYKGAKEIILFDDINDLDQFERSNIMVVGEKDGYKIDGFDIGNSPKEVLNLNRVKDKVLFKTSNGVRCCVACPKTEEVFVTGFLGVNELLEFLITNKKNKRIELVSSHPSSDDDYVIAEYMKNYLTEEERNFTNLEIVERIYKSESAEKFLNIDKDYFSLEDLEICSKNRFDFEARPKVMRASYNTLYKKQVLEQIC